MKKLYIWGFIALVGIAIAFWVCLTPGNTNSNTNNSAPTSSGGGQYNLH